MATERWRRIRELFDAAAPLDETARRALLDRACGVDEALRHEVESLLAHDDNHRDERDERDETDSSDTFGALIGDAAQAITESASPEERPSLTGRRVGNIRVQALLGEGGMGEVYIGLDETLERQVALKTIRARDRLTTAARTRFRREARVLSQLDHPNICRIHDYLSGDGDDYLVLELVRGAHLEEAIAAGMAPHARMKVAIQTTAVLVFAHAKGIVHRDIKPRNIMVAEDGETKVLDFGLARFEPSAVDPSRAPTEYRAPDGLRDARVEATRSAHTRRDQILGTPIYMSPEQARGEIATTASDMYSLGLLFQRLFADQAPYPDGLTAEHILDRARRGETQAATGLDTDLAGLINHLKAIPPASRPTAEATLERLHWIQDKPRRRLRRWAIAAALLVVTAVAVQYTLGLKAARDVANQRRAQAESLIGFMIGDLRGKLAPVNRLEVLDDIGEKARAYFATVPPDELSTSELLMRSQTLSQIGQVRLDQGSLPAALTAFEASLDLARGLVDRDPSNLEWLAWLGTAHFWIGNVDWLREAPDKALARFEAYLDVSRALVARQPDNLDWQLEVSYAHNNVGSAHAALGDGHSAIEAFRASLAIKQQLVASRPDDDAWKSDLAGTHSWLAEALFDTTDFSGALEHYKANQGLLASLSEQEPANTHRRFLLGIAHEKVGYVLDTLGRWREAEAHFQSSLALFIGLTKDDPENASWRRELAVAYRRLGQVRSLTGGTQAEDHLRQARVILDTLVRVDPSNANWRSELATTLVWLGDHLGRQQAHVAARAAVENAILLFESLPPAVAAGNKTRRRRATAALVSGALHADQGESLLATNAFERTLARAPTPSGSSSHPRDRMLRAMALLYLDRVADARPIATNLCQQGLRRLDFVRLCRAKSIDCETASVAPE